MVSENGKLIILDDIVVNRNYKKAKRIISKGIGFNSNPSDPDGMYEEIFRRTMAGELREDIEKDIAKRKEELDKAPLSAEEAAYKILDEMDKSFMNDKNASMSNVIRSAIQTYWDGVEIDSDKIKGLKDPFSRNIESKMLKMKRSILRFTKKIFSSKTITVEEMLGEVVESLEALDVNPELTDKFKRYIEIFRKLDNNPHIFQAAIKIAVLENECRLIKDGRFVKYISEDQIVKFIRSTEEGLAIDYMSNYEKSIPQQAVNKFEEAESVEAFDNYIILHRVNKKEKKSLKEHHERVDGKRDPIMFGVIKGSRKLYYICDWIDEYCDLTLSKLLDKIKEKEFNLIID